MKISYVEKRAVDNLRTSALAGSRVFFMRERELVSRSVHAYDAETVHEEIHDRVDEICAFGECLLVFCGNAMHRYRVFGDELVASGVHRLREPPVKIAVCDGAKRESRAVCFLYRSKQIEIFSEELESVTVCCKSEVVREDEIVDFCVSDSSSWFLARSGNIYSSHSFVLTRTVLLNRPMRMLPEPTAFEGDAWGMAVKDNRMYVCYEDGFEMYRIHRNVLVLVYTYRTSNYALYVSDHVFCAEDRLLVVDKAPRVVGNMRVQKMFGNVGVCADRVVFVREEREEERNELQLLKEGSAARRAEEMFGVLRMDFQVPEIEEGSEKTLLMVQKTANDFERRVLDGYRKAYFELVVINEGFPEMMDGVDAENKAILEKVDVLDRRKNGVVERLRSLNERMNETLSRMRIDGEGVRELIGRAERAVDEIDFRRHEKYAKLLRMQREILNRRIVSDGK